MLYIPNSCTDPYYNQAFEQAVFELCTEGDILLVWRNSKAVVCGRNQNIFAEICLPEAERRGVSVIRRDTGGGTVYHDAGNINYTLISNCTACSVDYDTPIAKIVSALVRLGIPAYKNRTCDIAIDGKKISGSAQRQTKKRVLHHGTLLYDADLSALRQFSQGTGRGCESKAVSSDRCEVTNISEYVNLGSALDFAEKLSVILCDDKAVPSEEILSLTDKLRAEKYSSWEWTYGRNPAFSCKRSSGEISVEYSAKRGVITDFTLTCGDISKSVTEFIGERLATTAIRKICDKVTDKEHAKILFGIIFGEI